MKEIIISITLLFICIIAKAQVNDNLVVKNIEFEEDSLLLHLDPDKLSDSYLDTVNVDKNLSINNYQMIGISYGASLHQMYFNPDREQSRFITYNNIGIIYTHYAKLFGYMPYFGLKAGILYGKEGYKFKVDERGFSHAIDHSIEAQISYIEFPFMSHFHIDVWRLKLMMDLGFYGGYRLAIQRRGSAQLDAQYVNKFLDHDIRFDYGFEGGIGLGLIFNPIEIHFNTNLKQSLSTLYQPDAHSKYYYSFAYPSSLIFSISLHVQLSKRLGKTKAYIKEKAHSIVFPKGEDIYK